MTRILAAAVRDAQGRKRRPVADMDPYTAYERDRALTIERRSGGTVSSIDAKGTVRTIPEIRPALTATEQQLVRHVHATASDFYGPNLVRRLCEIADPALKGE